MNEILGEDTSMGSVNDRMALMTGGGHQLMVASDGPSVTVATFGREGGGGGGGSVGIAQKPCCKTIKKSQKQK